MVTIARIGTAIVCVFVGALAPSTAVAEPVSCAPAAATIAAAAVVRDEDWAEGLAYDAHGDLWVSRVRRNEVVRYDPSGRVRATVAIPFPGAVKLGPDHRIYVTYGNFLTNLVPGSTGGGVVRVDPEAEIPEAETFVSGLGMANGAAFDAAGNLFVADTSTGVVRIRPDGHIDTEWSNQAKHFGADGILVDGDALYVTLYLSPNGRILRIPLDDPSHATVVADLAAGPGAPPLPDDLAIGPDGLLYDATTAGRLVRIDPTNHSTCTVLTDEPMTSIVVSRSSEREFLVGTASGNLLRVRLPE
ncbi:SMP-30/gluconolactonase/LRE family protein [Nocardia sp. NPDC050630]|uniref:SMP-30/gluconolactonase/LRE family protein n=1 Tax=Nocardia sp. NPDC050630 TaxID=3364321 RepID=UPI0037ADD973